MCVCVCVCARARAFFYVFASFFRPMRACLKHVDVRAAWRSRFIRSSALNDIMELVCDQRDKNSCMHVKYARCSDCFRSGFGGDVISAHVHPRARAEACARVCWLEHTRSCTAVKNPLESLAVEILPAYIVSVVTYPSKLFDLCCLRPSLSDSTRLKSSFLFSSTLSRRDNPHPTPPHFDPTTRLRAALMLLDYEDESGDGLRGLLLR